MLFLFQGLSLAFLDVRTVVVWEDQEKSVVHDGSLLLR
jgi:hypothetical protein